MRRIHPCPFSFPSNNAGPMSTAAAASHQNIKIKFNRKLMDLNLSLSCSNLSKNKQSKFLHLIISGGCSCSYGTDSWLHGAPMGENGGLDFASLTAQRRGTPCRKATLQCPKYGSPKSKTAKTAGCGTDPRRPKYLRTPPLRRQQRVLGLSQSAGGHRLHHQPLVHRQCVGAPDRDERTASTSHW
mmetsp:Transcript_18223/g.28279  ORF Transcript_18223/g.28279 Transcript_18223/m.28279 type:complete len:185 (-) Transcript_18223:759-1313(-)